MYTAFHQKSKYTNTGSLKGDQESRNRREMRRRSCVKTSPACFRGSRWRVQYLKRFQHKVLYASKCCHFDRNMPVQCLNLKKVVTNVFVIGSMTVIGLITTGDSRMVWRGRQMQESANCWTANESQ